MEAAMSASEIELKNRTGEVFALVRREIERFADSLSAEEKSRAGSLEHWSAQFTLVHLAFWENHYAAVFENGLAGERVPLSGSYLDQLNDGVLYEHLGQPFEAARADEAAAYNKFLDFYERGVSPEALADPTPLAYLRDFTLLNRVLRSYALHPVHHLSDYYVKNGKAERAEELQESLSQAVAQLPMWRAEAFYKLASSYALMGWPERALIELGKAVDENPKLRTQARADDDFESLSSQAAFEQIVGHP
jgi:tetratricopeptide (TPR) repeat protein